MAGVNDTLRVATWNIWWHFGPWEQRQQAIIASLESLNADVICLQEVWSEVTGANQAGEIAAALGYNYIAGPNHWVDGEALTNAILTRYPIAATESRTYTNDPRGFTERHAILAEIAHPRHRLRVICTHWEWFIQSSALRQKQATELLSFVEKLRIDPDSDYPVIVCGDFNCEPNSDEMRMLTGASAAPVGSAILQDTWRAARGDEPGYTWDRRNPYQSTDPWPDRRLDFVLVGWPRPAEVGRTVSSSLFGIQPAAGVVPSDHYGVVSDLTI